MKQAMKNNKAIILSLFALVAMAFTSPAIAADNKENPTVEIKYIGNLKNQPVFQVNLNNTTDDEFTINIVDQYGYTLYSEKLKGEFISRKYQLNTEEIADAKLHVEIKAKKANTTEVYEINNKTSFVQEVGFNRIY